MTTNELGNRLTKLLKNFIKSKGYVDSGALYKSINFNISDSPASNLDISLNAQEYILYLEQGRLIEEFFDTNQVADLITTYEIEKITDLL